MYGGDGRRTITGALKAGALNPSQSPDALPEPKPLHRLDAAVGGVLLIAKTATAAADISKQFVERRVHKVYHALLCGRLPTGGAVEQQPDLADLQQQDAQRSAATTSSSTAEQPESEDRDAAAAAGAAGASSCSSTSTSASTSEADDDAEEGGGGGDDDDDPAQLLPLAELMQRQLQGQPAFTTNWTDLADPVLEGPEDLKVVGNSTSSSEPGTSDGAHPELQQLLAAGDGVHVVDLPVEGKPSYSLYRVLGYSRSSRYDGWVTSVALSPVTGRKHQLRRHMAALGCPMVGDGK